MKKIIILIICLLPLLKVHSQVQLTQYFMDGTVYNPALTGANGSICTGIFGRQQWINLTDAENNRVSPSSMVFNLQAPVYSINSGIGLYIIYDKAAFEENKGINLNYAYRIPLNNEKHHLGLGIGLSLLNRTISFDQYIPEQPGDPLLKINNKESGMLSDLNVGMIFQTGKKYFVALSVSNLLESTSEIGNVASGNSRQYNLMAEYHIAITENRSNSISLVPSVFIKATQLNTQADLSARLLFNNFYWAGLSYRYQDATALMAGINYNGFRFGASYDVSIGRLAKVNDGSVELFLGYCYPITPKVKLNSLYNTRYL